MIPGGLVKTSRHCPFNSKIAVTHSTWNSVWIDNKKLNVNIFLESHQKLAFQAGAITLMFLVYCVYNRPQITQGLYAAVIFVATVVVM